MRKALSFGVRKHLVEEDFAGISLLIENISLTQAGINQQSEGKRQVGVLRKVFDRLRPAIFLKNEIVLGQIADNLTFLITNGDRKRDHLDVNRHSGDGLAMGVVILRWRQSR